MAIIYNRDQQGIVRDSQDGQAIARFFFQKPDRHLIVKPGAKGPTTLRIFPEIDRDGNLLPLVLDLSPINDREGNLKGYAPNATNAVQANTTTCQGYGRETWFTGVTDPSDIPGASKFDSPFSAYIKLQSKFKKSELAPEILRLFQAITTKPPGKFSGAMTAPDETLLVRVAVAKLDGKAFPKPALNGALIAKGSAQTAYLACLVRAFQQGRDLASPTEGFPITFGTLPEDKSMGRNTTIRTCVMGYVPFTGLEGQTVAGLEAAAKPAPIPEALLRQHWVDLGQELKRHTYSALMAAAIKSYGPELVQVAFPDQYEAYLSENAPVETRRTAVAVTGAPVGATTTSTTQARPAQATRPAPAPAPADDLPGFGSFDTAGDLPAQNPASAAAVTAASQKAAEPAKPVTTPVTTAAPAAASKPAADRPGLQVQSVDDMMNLFEQKTKA